MLAASSVDILLVPALFYLVERWSGVAKGHAPRPIVQPSPSEAD
jgi:hypothetical protein